MRTVVQKIGLLTLSAAMAIWLIGGAKKGMYVTSEELILYDPVTQIEGIDNHEKFLPGVESLAIGIILGGSFYLISFLLPKKV